MTSIDSRDLAAVTGGVNQLTNSVFIKGVAPALSRSEAGAVFGGPSSVSLRDKVHAAVSNGQMDPWRANALLRFGTK